MPELQAKSLEMRTPQATKTAVLVIGGAEDKVHGREILRTFLLVLAVATPTLPLFPLLPANLQLLGVGIFAFLRIWELKKSSF